MKRDLKIAFISYYCVDFDNYDWGIGAINVGTNTWKFW